MSLGPEGAQLSKALLKSKAKTFVTDKGFDNAMKEIAKARAGSFVKVGVLADAQKPEDAQGLTMQQLAAVHEFGTTKAGRGGNITIPERSFIRSTMDERRGELNRLTDKVITQVMLGQYKMKQGLAILGEFIEAAIKRKMTLMKDPPNAPSTIAQKGSSNPLIDTGRLRASIRHKTVVKNKPMKRKIPVNGELNVKGPK
jgi:phage gpG-like protein